MWYITIDQSTQFAKSIPGCQFSNGHPILAVFYGVELGSFGVWDSTTHIPNIIIFRVMHHIYLCAFEHLYKFCFLNMVHKIYWAQNNTHELCTAFYGKIQKIPGAKK